MPNKKSYALVLRTDSCKVEIQLNFNFKVK